MRIKCPCCLSDKVQIASTDLREYADCRSCGFMFRIAGNRNLARRRMLQHYDHADPHRQVAISKRPFFIEMLQRLEPTVPTGKCLLDIGCGFGYFLALADEHGWQTCGVEITAEGVRASRKVVGAANVFHGTTQAAGYTADTFDAVTMWDVMVFMDDPEAELRECLRVLKTGGRIGIRVRNISFQKRLFRLYRPFKRILHRLGIRAPYVFHPQNFSRAAIDRLLRRVGFCKIQITNSPLTRGDPYRNRQAARLTGMLKTLIAAGASALYQLSGGRWTAGPSLLVWAEKPAVEISPND